MKPCTQVCLQSLLICAPYVCTLVHSVFHIKVPPVAPPEPHMEVLAALFCALFFCFTPSSSVLTHQVASSHQSPSDLVSRMLGIVGLCSVPSTTHVPRKRAPPDST